MGANTDNPGNLAEAELAKLEARLHKHVGDDAMLADIGAAMRSLVADNRGSAEQIRAFVRKRFEAGQLRRESMELVDTLLHTISANAMSESHIPDGDVDVPFTRTTVIDPIEPSENDGQFQLQVGTMLRDRFLLKQEIADGSMGLVFKALDRRLAEAGDDNAFVAIKVLNAQLSRNSDALRALQQEAAKGRCLAHPNIVRFIDLDRENDTYFIVMEWLDGRSLASILDEKAGGAMDFDAAMDIVRQIAKALDYAHERGVVHADVKPGNVMLTRDGVVKLIDFGIARVRQEQIAGKAKFDPAVLSAGTPAYSSMQVLTGESPVPADDVFSLACLFYRLVAGYRVFGPRNAAAAAEAGMDPQQPQGVSDRQWQAMKKALSYSRVTRFATPAEFIKALSGGPEEVVITVPPRDIDVDDAPRRSPWRMVVVVATILGSIALVTQTNVVDRVKELVAARSGNTDNMQSGSIDEPENTADAGRAVDLDSPAATVDESAVRSIDTQNDSSIDASTALPDDSARASADAPPAELAADPANSSMGPGADRNEERVPAENEDTSAAYFADQADATNGETMLLAESNAPGAVNSPDSAQRTEPLIPEFDFTSPPPDLVVNIGAPEPGVDPLLSNLVIREGGRDAIIDLVRTTDIDQSRIYTILENRFVGTVSPLETGQYSIVRGGEIAFAAGQGRARTTISVRADPVREQDQQITLTVHAVNNLNLALAGINMTIEDDDQRDFEASLAPDTVAFAVNQISVHEADSAVQIDVIRYKATDTPLEVTYTVNDVTARHNEDYFSPALTVVYFNPGQRTARILIPLVQDSAPERDEAFMLELDTGNASTDSNIYSQIAVMIRDDDS